MYHYEDCGLPNVYLQNGYEIKQTRYGEGVAITDLEGLHRALAKNIILMPRLLTADEFRFLRKELDLSQQHLADILGVDDSTIRNWESGKKISKMADSCMRRLYEENQCRDSIVARSIREISSLSREKHELEHELALKLNECNNTWHVDETTKCA